MYTLWNAWLSDAANVGLYIDATENTPSELHWKKHATNYEINIIRSHNKLSSHDHFSTTDRSTVNLYVQLLNCLLV